MVLLVPLMTVVYRAKSLVALVPVVAAFVDPGPTSVPHGLLFGSAAGALVITDFA